MPSTAAQQRRLFEFVGNNDGNIREVFLSLSPLELEELLGRYELAYGRAACLYAKRTYARWKSGEVKISEVVLERLRQLQVLKIDEAPTEQVDLYEQIKKLRQIYMHRENRQVSCSPTSWFRKVHPVVNELIECSKRFRFPGDVLEQMNWLTSGEAMALNQVLELVEMEEARTRTQYLAQEYEQVRRWFEEVKDVTSFVHTICLPQGTIEVTVSLPKKSLLQRLRVTKAKDDVGKRTLSISCKNPKCRAELETSYSAYEDEPVVIHIGDLTCPYCRITYSYVASDFHINQRVELERGLRGHYSICYDCPNCDTALYSPLEMAGKPETCTKCGYPFIVPGAGLPVA